jgi:hypothetical protein
LKPADWQTKQFHAAGWGWYSVERREPGRLEIGGERRCACWLWQYDVEQEGEDNRDCSGRIEAFHFVSRQRIRNVLFAQLRHLPKAERDELTCLAEWDPRWSGPGCTVHHRAYDGHVTSGLKIPAAAVPLHALRAVVHWGLEDELQSHCRDDLEPVIEARIGVPDRRYSCRAREQPLLISEGQPSA